MEFELPVEGVRVQARLFKIPLNNPLNADVFAHSSSLTNELEDETLINKSRAGPYEITGVGIREPRLDLPS